MAVAQTVHDARIYDADEDLATTRKAVLKQLDELKCTIGDDVQVSFGLTNEGQILAKLEHSGVVMYLDSWAFKDLIKLGEHITWEAGNV
jgi:hypothetical protein